MTLLIRKRRSHSGGAELGLAQGRVVALSPHLDDAVWSIGATLADAARAGAEVTVVTVLAGDPESRAPAGAWDRLAGFRSAGEAVRVRRGEDRRACAIVGARPVWLPFGDEQYERGGGDGEVWDAVEGSLDDADVVLVPGFPLSHADHRWLTGLVAGQAGFAGRLALYAEQPYAMWRLRNGGRSEGPSGTIASPFGWFRLAPSPAGWWAKQRAARAYRSQLQVKRGPYRRLPLRLALHEARRRGEALAWIPWDGLRNVPTAAVLTGEGAE